MNNINLDDKEQTVNGITNLLFKELSKGGAIAIGITVLYREDRRDDVIRAITASIGLPGCEPYTKEITDRMGNCVNIQNSGEPVITIFDVDN